MKKLLLVPLLALAGAAGLYWWTSAGHASPLRVRDLTFANLQLGAMRDVVSATGLVEPRETVVVSGEAPGVVLRLLARVNDTVVEGADLAHLDDRRAALKVEEARLGVQTAEATLAHARAALRQARARRDGALLALKAQDDLAKRGGVRAERDQAEVNVRSATAAVEAGEAGVRAAQTRRELACAARRDAEFARELLTVKVPDPPSRSVAPREFLVLERKVCEGQFVGPQSGPLFVLASGLERIDVHAQIAEGDVNKVRAGLDAVFSVTGYGDVEASFRGTVREVRPVAASVKGAVYFDTVIRVENRRDAATGAWLLRPGMTASIDVIRREHKNVWKVPSAAMNFRLEEAYQSDEAKARLTEWRRRPDAADWHTLWTWDSEHAEARPLFVRIGGLRKGEPGLKDGEGNEVLEFEPGRTPAPQCPPRVIIGAPPAHAPGLFDQPANIKVS